VLKCASANIHYKKNGTPPLNQGLMLGAWYNHLGLGGRPGVLGARLAGGFNFNSV
jgi:hypothetical protein